MVDGTEIAARIVTDPDAPLLKVGQEPREYHRALLARQFGTLVPSEEHRPLIAALRITGHVAHDDITLEVRLATGHGD
jgi:hypothetical protein